MLVEAKNDEHSRPDSTTKSNNESGRLRWRLCFAVEWIVWWNYHVSMLILLNITSKIRAENVSCNSVVIWNFAGITLTQISSAVCFLLSFSLIYNAKRWKQSIMDESKGKNFIAHDPAVKIGRLSRQVVKLPSSKTLASGMIRPSGTTRMSKGAMKKGRWVT